MIEQDLSWLLADKKTVEGFIKETPPENVIDLASWKGRLRTINEQIEKIRIEKSKICQHSH
jgi:hypothetical protein